jgi:hypothetical protein
MRCVFLRAAFRSLANLACFLILVSSAGSVLAHDHSGGNCSNCHAAPPSSRETVTSPTSVSVLPGDLVSFTINVSNANSAAIAAFTGKTTSGSAAEPLTAVAGTANAANTLNVVPDSTTAAGWTAQPHTSTTKTYYTSNTPGSAFSATFSFYVPAGTPADTYQMWLKTSEGTTSGGPKWTQGESVSVTVGAVPEPGTLAMLLGGALVGLVCWRGRKRLAAK